MSEVHSMHRSTRNGVLAVSFAALASLTGCAQNAIFELHVRFPTTAQVPGVRFIRVQVQPTTAAFDTSFDTGGTHAIAVPTTPTESGVMVSIPATSEEITSGLHVKVLLCRDEACTTPIAERWYNFERVFYRARFTCFDVPFEENVAPETVIDIATCDIAGCRNGNSGVNNCTGSTHDCESPEALRESDYCTNLFNRDRP